MIKRLGPAFAAVLAAAALGSLAVSPASAGDSRSGSPAQRTAARTHAFLAALEREDLRTVAAMTDERATLTVALSFSGAREPAGRFVGEEQVLGYVRVCSRTWRSSTSPASG